MRILFELGLLVIIGGVVYGVFHWATNINTSSKKKK